MYQHVMKDWTLYTKSEIEEYQRELAKELRKIKNPDGSRALSDKTVTAYAYGKRDKDALEAMAQCMQFNTPEELAKGWTM